MSPRKIQSKRVSCAKRYKIEKRAKEHARKQKKEAKKNPKHGKSKKDPGIPNSWPFKEQLLNEIEERKQKLAQEKEEKKQIQRAKNLKAKEAATKAESA